jgi:thiol-disulfide isomerase/thioredoxin
VSNLQFIFREANYVSGFNVPSCRSNRIRRFHPFLGSILGSLVLTGCSGENGPTADVSSEVPTQGTDLPDSPSTSRGKPVAAIARAFDVPQRDRRASVPSEKDIVGINAMTGGRHRIREDQELANPASDSVKSPESHNLLEIGDKAPEISVVHWLKGNPVNLPDSSTVVVLEFWATNINPCLDVIPQICALQAEYGDRVTFAGISPEEESVVAKFLDDVSRDGRQKWSEILNYSVGIDPRRQTWNAYLDASEHQGIPCSVVIGRNGKVAWIGHPQDLEGPLKQIVDGTWNVDEAKQLAIANRVARKAKQELSPEIRAVIDSREYSHAVELIDAFLQRFPNDADMEMLRLKCLFQGEMYDVANTTAETLIAAAQDDARQLDKLAWMIATTSESPKINLDLALAAAQRAAELTDQADCSVIETLARVQFRKSNLAEAIALQKKAIHLAANSAQAEPLRVALEEYLKAQSAKDR